jgi:hypothetical protein
MLTQLVNGLGGAIGSRFMKVHNRLAFVEFNGKISTLDLVAPLAGIVSQGTTLLKGTWVFDCETGNLGGNLNGPGDIWWEQQTAIDRRMVPVGGAKIINLGHVDFNSVTSATLQNLAYGTAPIVGNNNATNQLTTGDVFAVQTNAGNYAKVKVVAYGYDMQIQWVTYKLGSRYKVIGTGYTQPEDIAVTADELRAYVTERTGDLLRVNLSNANRAAATVVSTGMNAPHQISLDETHNQAYLVEYHNPGRLIRVNLANGAQTVLVNNLENAVGLLVTSDLAYAYVGEQAASGGRVTRITLNSGHRDPVAAGLTAPFFMSFADGTEDLILITERSPLNRVVSIDVTHLPGTVTTIAGGVPSNPSSVALVAPGKMLVCCDQEIDLVDVSLGLQPGGPLFMGIGNVPFNRITPAGKADTTVDPAYFYQVKDAPFGGVLPLLVNHQRAWNDGARYYRVIVDGAPRLDSFSDYHFNVATNVYELQTTAPVVLPTGPGFYPVHGPADQFLWLHPALGDRMNTVPLANGLHSIHLDFVNAFGVAVESSPPVAVLIDNNSCTGTLALPTLNGTPASPQCGTLNYQPGPAGSVVMAFTATHPNGFATYSFRLIKGVNSLTPPSVGGPVLPAPPTPTDTAAHLLGNCKTAGFAEYLSVAATAINGESRQSQYDASAAVAFVLTPA